MSDEPVMVPTAPSASTGTPADLAATLMAIADGCRETATQALQAGDEVRHRAYLGFAARFDGLARDAAAEGMRQLVVAGLVAQP